ncbi:MAG: sulfatase, partial [Acidobacteriota bacterium]
MPYMRPIRFFRQLCLPALACTVLILAACGGSPLIEVVDLAAVGDSAEVMVEPGIIDVGTTEARPFLAAGWSRDERDRRTGQTFVWSLGDHSAVDFFLQWRRDLTIEIVGRPFNFPNAPNQQVNIDLNGTPVGTVEPAAGTHSYTVDLPAGAQVVGRNRLRLSYDHNHAPIDVKPRSEDRRELAVAWQMLVFSGPGLQPDRHPPVPNGKPSLRIGSGTRWQSFINLPAGSVLRMASLNGHGKTESTLVVSVLQDQGEEIEAAVLHPSQNPISIDLGVLEGLIRLRFEITSEDPGATHCMDLMSPTILAPQARSRVKAEFDPPPAPLPDRPNVIIYLVDALRADRLGCYGYQRPTSPRLDGFAAEGILFTNAIAQSSWTKASVASIFTGVWPPAHGANGPEDILPEGLPTLTERLAEAGYQTAAVIANAYVNRPFGFARGFDHFTFLPDGEGSSEAINDSIVQWLDQNPEEPFFLYVHTIDPHAPYEAPEPFQSRFAADVTDTAVGQVETVRGLVRGTVEPTPELARDLNNLYDAEVAHNDAGFGSFLDTLTARGLYENTVILFVSDHGEAFGEHGTWTHGIDLYSEVLHVPLVLRLPGGRLGGRRVDRVAQHIDILPTVLRLTGVEDTTPGRGHYLLDSSAGPRTATSYLNYWGRHGASVVTNDWK